MKTIAIIHTSFVLVELLNKLAKELLPETNIINIVDDTLLAYARKNGIDNKLIRRMCIYFHSAVEAGADIILNACSSVGETVYVGRQIFDVPIIRIDEPMAEVAIKSGEKIAVIATIESTLKPTVNLLQLKANEKGIKPKISTFLVKGAFDLLLEGKVEEHNRLIKEETTRVSKDYDVILFAQASMAKLASLIEKEFTIPILTSPKLAMEYIKNKYLK